MSAASPVTWNEGPRLSRLMLAAGGAGLLLGALGFFLEPDQFFRSYLVAFLFWLALPVGSLALLLIHSMTGGRWGVALQRILEAATETFPLLALFFVPVLLGMHHLYPWTDAEEVAHDPILQKKSLYLNITFFTLRAGIYFGAWTLVSLLMNYWSATRRGGFDPVRSRRRQTFAGPATALLGLTVTFASIDWIMSLQPHWFSSIFGPLVAVSQILPSFAFGIVMLVYLSQRTTLGERVGPMLYNDLGNLLLAFVMIWTYLMYCQFFLIWSGNLIEEISWYAIRMAGGWEWAGMGLILLYFVFPFILLLSRQTKRDPRKLVWVAGLLLVMHLVYQYWLIVPSFPSHVPSHGHSNYKHGLHGLHWMDLPILVGIGGVWLACFFWRLPTRTLLAEDDPEWEEGHHHG